MTDHPSPASSATSALEELVFECLERIEREGEGAVEVLCAAHPAHARALREQLKTLRHTGLIASQRAEPAFPERLGDFRLLTSLGGGGMGIVYLAEQTSLGREVALKLIRPEHLYFPGARERFRREVEAVARLQHPALVPIYTVGEERGIPYFAMERVHGVSLSEVVSAFQGRDPAELGGRDLLDFILAKKQPSKSSSEVGGRLFQGSWVDAACRIVSEVAQAVEHAHERGVLHRDIKPSNVMVTASGRVVLLDFGLASLTGTDPLTRTGSQLGSIPYMAPEQLDGDIARIDARTDVYGLGVTLYELIAFKPPYFDAQSSERTRQLVLAGRATPLRACVRGLSRDVETVCATAMEPLSARRYASAAALAADLDNVLARRTILARRAGPLLKLWRWTQRHPASASAITLAICAPLAFAVQQRAANVELRAAHREVSRLNEQLGEALVESEQQAREKETQRAAAQLNFERSLRAVDTMLTRVGMDRLRYVPQMEPVRSELLGEAADFYRDLLAERPGDARLFAETMRTRTKLGDVLLRQGRFEDARRELVDLAASLRASPAHEAGQRHQLALVLGLAADAERGLSHAPESLALAREAVALLEELVGRADDDEHHDERVRALATHLYRVADLEHATGESGAAEATHARAVELLRPFLALAEPTTGDLFYCAKSLDRLASLRAQREDFAGAIEAARESSALLEQLHAREPANSDVALQLFSALGNLGDLLGQSGRGSEAAPHVERAVSLGERIVTEFPSTPRYRQNLSIACVQLFFVEMERGDTALAQQRLEQALALQERLVADEPTNAEYVGAICVTYGNLGALLARLDQPTAALERFAAGTRAVTGALDANAKNPDWIRWHTLMVENRASLLVTLGRWREAAAAARELDRHATQAEPALKAARIGAQALRAALKNTDSIAAEREAIVEHALSSLRSAVERGLADPRALSNQAEWSPLDEHADFRALLDVVSTRSPGSRPR